MIRHEDIKQVLAKYDKNNISIGVLGGHSALDISSGAKKLGFRTVAVCQRGREKTYSKYFRARDSRGIIDEIILVDKFSDITMPEVQEKLRKLNTIFIHNRYFWVYCKFEDIMNDFKVPIFGTRPMVRLEERHVPNNQYEILRQANIRIPKIFDSPEQIDRLAIVKVAEAARGYERAFFFVKDAQDFRKKSEDLIRNRVITKKALDLAVIEEYIVGAHINLNFFYSPLSDELELLGTDTRRQTNLDGILRLPAEEQLEVLKYMRPKYIETGHIAVTMKESLLEKAFGLGERFVAATKKASPPGIIGPFALQGAVIAEEGKEDFVIFDVSMRMPGSPGTKFTPYGEYLHRREISFGDRIAMEIKEAIKQGKIDSVCT
ncbi:MAG: 5-formaminoimidazole-4-carboxamide-1-(beta)-D-ribofuranosyl 5'-monophosphate synthetase [archaeon GW2011_AR3]|nr:MAG: 5-formaminoimidazole-4-carboxamide-1-(beta)-D-ribofuranosyl 5'-monophosphate synthetase [archaeon GW2011_AR3]MBS3110089.1 DUF1297 domain-containing protein [Candidatus Woesearchaeota archaeon]